MSTEAPTKEQQLLCENASLRALLQELMTLSGWRRSEDGLRWRPSANPEGGSLARRVSELEAQLQAEHAAHLEQKEACEKALTAIENFLGKLRSGTVRVVFSYGGYAQDLLSSLAASGDALVSGMEELRSLTESVRAFLDRLGPYGRHVGGLDGSQALPESLAATAESLRACLPPEASCSDPLVCGWTLANAGYRFTPLYDFLCRITGATPEQFAKHDKVRGTFDPDQNPDHYATTVQLLDLMRIRGSGWEWVAYMVASEPACKVRQLRRLLAADQETLAMLRREHDSMPAGEEREKHAEKIANLLKASEERRAEISAVVKAMFAYDPLRVPLDFTKEIAEAKAKALA